MPRVTRDNKAEVFILKHEMALYSIQINAKLKQKHVLP